MKNEINLATTHKEDYTINSKGEGFISQRELERISGIPRTTLQDWFKNKSAGYILNKNNQLSHKCLLKVVLSGRDKQYPKCIKLLDKITEAGSKAFVYHQAGYKMQTATTPLTLKTRIAFVEEQLQLMKDLEETQETVEVIETANDLSEEWLSVSRVRGLFPDVKAGGNLLTRLSKELGYEVKKRDHPYTTGQVAMYHKAVWFEGYGIEFK